MKQRFQKDFWKAIFKKFIQLMKQNLFSITTTVLYLYYKTDRKN